MRGQFSRAGHAMKSAGEYGTVIAIVCAVFCCATRNWCTGPVRSRWEWGH